MNSLRIGDTLVYGIAVAGILVLTRPGSQGVGLIRALGANMIGFVQAITGQRVSKF